jgi:hypothetical protein
VRIVISRPALYPSPLRVANAPRLRRAGLFLDRCAAEDAERCACPLDSLKVYLIYILMTLMAWQLAIRAAAIRM